MLIRCEQHEALACPACARHRRVRSLLPTAAQGARGATLSARLGFASDSGRGPLGARLHLAGAATEGGGGCPCTSCPRGPRRGGVQPAHWAWSLLQRPHMKGWTRSLCRAVIHRGRLWAGYKEALPREPSPFPFARAPRTLKKLPAT